MKELKINQKYKLELLKEIEKENLDIFFREGKGVYLCNMPDQTWYDNHGFARGTNYSIEKKKRYFSLMNMGSCVLSMTKDSKIRGSTKNFSDGDIHHIGNPLDVRVLGQFVMMVRGMNWAFKHRHDFDYMLVYNFYFFPFLVGMFSKYILGKKCYVDFEDDYLLQKPSFLSDFIFSIKAKCIDGVICINSSMKQYFSNIPVRVFNGFINLEYVKKKTFDIEEESIFLYSGALDNIRGADLLKDLKAALNEKLKKFKIYVSGSGPLADRIKELEDDTFSFFGFLGEQAYNDILHQSDFLLVLQKPDHPFSQGSFPSKIEKYCEYKKPILVLKLAEI